MSGSFLGDAVRKEGRLVFRWGQKTRLAVVDNNAEESVTWVTSYVSLDRRTTFCAYDGPSSESIERAAVDSGLRGEGP